MTFLDIARTALEIVVFLAVIAGIFAIPHLLITKLGKSLPNGKLKTALFKERFHVEPVRPSPPTAVDRAIGRVLIRSMRIQIGIAIACIGYLFLIGGVKAFIDTPFFQLTPRLLFTGLSKVALLAAIAYIGMLTAFGNSYPQEPRNRV
jgi:hypothetical protein